MTVKELKDQLDKMDETHTVHFVQDYQYDPWRNAIEVVDSNGEVNATIHTDGRESNGD